MRVYVAGAKKAAQARQAAQPAVDPTSLPDYWGALTTHPVLGPVRVRSVPTPEGPMQVVTSPDPLGRFPIRDVATPEGRLAFYPDGTQAEKHYNYAKMLGSISYPGTASEVISGLDSYDHRVSRPGFPRRHANQAVFFVY